MGHTIWIRANSLFTFASTALALVAILASITDIWHTAEPDVFLRVKSVERFRPVSPNAHRKKASSNNNEDRDTKNQRSVELSKREEQISIHRPRDAFKRQGSELYRAVGSDASGGEVVRRKEVGREGEDAG